jgi:hypothetical protein
VAPHYFELLYDRAASLAIALAASAGLNAPDEYEDNLADLDGEDEPGDLGED